ncbi:thiopeptide-type bacteriocin biosynthesis protein [Aquimarina muelleri]|uniref:thiopeptide-type bacteriocin biosynthesis protein n=1 Tax=Aquimarina muelleri TaxID=279356 RepID=UPI003F6829E0
MIDKHKHTWISAYLFYKESANKFLIQFISPFVEKIQQEKVLLRYFFIRYNEGGAHIRLRLLVEKDNENMWKERLKKESEIYWSNTHENIKKDKKFLYNHIQFTEYIPEIDRYGGMHVMNEAEKQFESSSEVVLYNLVRYSKNWKDNTAFLLAIKMHLLLFVSMDLSNKDMMKICKLFIQEWLPVLYDISKPQKEQQQFFLSEFAKKFNLYKEQMIFAVSTFLKDIKTNSLTENMLNAYYLKNESVNKVYKEKNIDLKIESSITTSFMHITHNRIGIINADEAYIVYLLYKCLENNCVDA